MAVSNKHILQQWPVIRAFGQSAARVALEKLRPSAPRPPLQVPGPELREILDPRPADLVRDYVRHVGGEAGSYKKTLPPHFFPQWAFALATRAMQGLPYPMASGLNAGCRLQVNAPLPSDEPLDVRARLASIDDDGRRALITTRIVTGTASAPEALEAEMRVIVLLGGRDSKAGSNGKAKGGGKDKPRVDESYREIARWRLGAGAGLDFAKLTGDFNPVHWIPAYARAFGFKNTILHGFGTMARAVEGLNRSLFSGATPIRVLEVRFTRPLVLPREVGLYVDGRGGLAVGDAPGGPAYMSGHYEVSND